MTTVLVCGGGNSAQAVTCLFAARNKVICLSLHENDAEKWNKAVKEAGGMTCTLAQEGKCVRSKPDLITNDPTCVSKCDLVLITVPSGTVPSAEEYFAALAPSVRAGTVFGVMPARSGIDFVFRKVMGAKADSLGLVAFETLPWACKFNEWGKTSTVLGVKDTVAAATLPPKGVSVEHCIMKLQGLLGTKPLISMCPNVMSISLSSPGQVVHPGLMYSRWAKWDGKPVNERPLFYHGADAFAEQTLTGISSEIQAICKKLRSMDSSFDTTQVKTFFEWYLSSYAAECSDTSSLQKAMVTNHAYKGIAHPCQVVKGKFVPDFTHRYLSEDVPTGLCFTHGVAELLGVRTPTITQVILWAQKRLGKEYLTAAGKMAGKDVKETRAPQACGVVASADLRTFLELKRGGRPLTCLAGICGQ